MSYILDALRRADAERERGEVPGLQSQQQHAALDDEEAAPARSRWMLAAIAALVVALAAAIGWNFVGGEPPRSPTVAAVAPTPVTVTPSPAAAVAAAPPVVVVAPPAPQPPIVANARPAEPRPAVRRVPASSPSPAPLSAKAAPASPETRIYARAELPAEVQRELPQVAIGGASYSNDAASRMVIINGLVFHEGDKIANGLVLEKIKLKAAVLAYKGWRYQVDY